MRSSRRSRRWSSRSRPRSAFARRKTARWSPRPATTSRSSPQDGDGERGAGVAPVRPPDQASRSPKEGVMSKFVVAGVTGHVGRVVAGDLLAGGEKVTVIVRDAEKGAPWSARGAQVAVGSLDDSSFVAATVKGADGLFALIPPSYGAADFFGALRQAADGIAAGVKAGGVPLVVLLSSVGA